LRSNALLALDGSLGHVTEVLSGDFYQGLSTSSPHQIWSAAMVVSPILRGMLGLSIDAKAHHITVAPHVPADWTEFAVRNLKVGSCSLNFRYRRTEQYISLETTRNDAGGDCGADFSPAVSLRAVVTGAQMDGHSVPFKLSENQTDQHVTVRFRANRGSSTLRIMLRNDFELGVHTDLPALGSSGSGLRVMNESWTPSHDALEMTVAGKPGEAYEMDVLGATQIKSIEGGELANVSSELAKLRIRIPAADDHSYKRSTVVFHFATKANYKTK
jgi:hypothetical protein